MILVSNKKMRQFFSLIALTFAFILTISVPLFVQAQPPKLFLAYPPENHQTNADSIFFIGSATEEVFINEQPIKRSEMGYFAPSFPLQIGTNKFTIRSENEEITRIITKVSTQPELPEKLGFAKNSLIPKENMARLPNELICFGAIANLKSTVKVTIGNQQLNLSPVSDLVNLPPNSEVLMSENTPNLESSTVKKIQNFQGCTSSQQTGLLGNPIFELTLGNQTIQQQSPAQIEILEPNRLQVIQVITNEGVSRTGPSTDFSRLTPLPKGTKASVTGKEGEWLRLDYGGWIKASETEILSNTIPPETLIRSINSRQLDNATEIIFPLQNPVPISINQENQSLSLTLYNTIAQIDTIRFDDNPLIDSVNWQQISPKQVKYTFKFKFQQQWGYSVRYEDTNLILTLRHPPKLKANVRQKLSLIGATIVLDPGHGGTELGSVGPNGYAEKDINLVVSKLLAKELISKGAKVYLTREEDQEISLEARVNMINTIKPTLALSIHYNALPDDGDAMKTQGIGTFWYHPQASDLAVFLHNYLVKSLNRPSYGVFWNNLALTRPYIAPSVLLELGFMINPEEFQWITDTTAQNKLAQAIADGITIWLLKNS